MAYKNSCSVISVQILCSSDFLDNWQAQLKCRIQFLCNKVELAVLVYDHFYFEVYVEWACTYIVLALKHHKYMSESIMKLYILFLKSSTQCSSLLSAHVTSKLKQFLCDIDKLPPFIHMC